MSRRGPREQNGSFQQKVTGHRRRFPTLQISWNVKVWDTTNNLGSPANAPRFCRCLPPLLRGRGSPAVQPQTRLQTDSGMTSICLSRSGPGFWKLSLYFQKLPLLTVTNHQTKCWDLIK